MKTLDYTMIYNVLMNLLEIPDGNPLPSGSGVCLEVGKATKKRYTHGAPLTDEYAWVSDHAKNFCGLAYVSDMGYMTPRRREFILYLLDRISKETVSD